MLQLYISVISNYVGSDDLLKAFTPIKKNRLGLSSKLWCCVLYLLSLFLPTHRHVHVALRSKLKALQQCVRGPWARQNLTFLSSLLFLKRL